ncbi:PREDICTED: uncharacterized protein LOC106743868 [Dinoponera quadriceps]|uniref:Uncharacterized protein LOC106743868 n=1 Tax=Dinoponera quadriceps TaxID=609295 RepID=A0A6P3X5K9_DINQU|nr:PREDICTED: uncharacterized protein LOC106743868 [Dinoponera quadriceps]
MSDNSKNYVDYLTDRSSIGSTTMAGQVQLAFLLVIAAFAQNDATPLADKRSPFSVQTTEHTVVLDKTFDRLLPYLTSFIIKNGLDPMELVDVSEDLLPDLPGIFKGHIDLKKGWLQNLAQIKRADHVIGKFTEETNTLVLNMDLGFNVLDFNYEYDISYMLLRRLGDMYGRFFDLKTKVLLTFDLKRKYISLDSIKFTAVGNYDIRFEGHILDPILNIATKVVTTIFKKSVLAHIEERSLKIFRAKIDEWNKILSRPKGTMMQEPIYVSSISDINTFKFDTLDIKLH